MSAPPRSGGGRSARRGRGISGSSRILSDASVIPRLPDWQASALRGKLFPLDIINAEIVRFGAAPNECNLEGGGLIIDYLPKGQSEPKRLVLAFNELGMWVEQDFIDER